MNDTPPQASDEAGVVERNFCDLPDEIQDHVTSAIFHSMVHVNSPEHAAALAETVWNALYEKGLIALSPPPVVEEAGLQELIEQLENQARRESEASKMLADAKTARQADRDDYPDHQGPRGYDHLRPEQTVSWKAAQRLRAVLAPTPPAGEAVERIVERLCAEHGVNEDDEHDDRLIVASPEEARATVAAALAAQYPPPTDDVPPKMGEPDCADCGRPFAEHRLAVGGGFAWCPGDKIRPYVAVSSPPPIVGEDRNAE